MSTVPDEAGRQCARTASIERKLWHLRLRTSAWRRLVPPAIDALGLEPATAVTRANPRLVAVSR